MSHRSVFQPIFIHVLLALLLLQSHAASAIPFNGTLIKDGALVDGRVCMGLVLTNQAGNVIWTSDARDPVASCIEVNVNNGFYAIELGNAEIMAPIPEAVYTTSDSIKMEIYIGDNESDVVPPLSGGIRNLTREARPPTPQPTHRISKIGLTITSPSMGLAEFSLKRQPR